MWGSAKGWTPIFCIGFCPMFAAVAAETIRNGDEVQAALLALPLPPNVAPITEDYLLTRVPPGHSVARGRLRYLPLIQWAAEKHGVPAAIADAVVRVESGYNQNVVGGVGEIGLMQVRPSTAAMLGFRGTNAELADPATNVNYGIAYLSKAWRLAGGDLCQALMKYRAGHGETRMTPLSVEYCRRARVHLASIGTENGSVEPSIQPAVAEASRAPKELNRTFGIEPAINAPRRHIAANSRLLSHGQSDSTLRLVGLAATRQYLTENRGRIQDAYARLSALRKPVWDGHNSRRVTPDGKLPKA